MKNKKYLLFIILILLFLIFFFKDAIKKTIKIKLKDNNIINLIQVRQILNTLVEPRYIFNDYNVVFLPETQTLNFDVEDINISFNKNKYKNLKRYSNFIELINNNLLLTTSEGDFQFLSLDILFKKNKFHETTIIYSNVKDLNIYQILNTDLIDNNLYISYKKKIDDGCNTVGVATAIFNYNNLMFQELFNLNECAKGPIWGGAIKVSMTKKYNGIFLTTSDVLRSEDENINKPKDLRSQLQDSKFGKILFYDFGLKNLIIFSKGLRNSQGLYIDKNTILSTDQGPKGGDEINLIKYQKNYGWPISSYGDLYWTKLKDPYYKKSHEQFNFKEPIYSFIPSIGITEIIKVPKKFDAYWKDNFIVTSLYGNSIYRIKFSNNFEKVLFSEKIFIGDRIRDIKFLENKNAIILSLENSADLKILVKRGKIN